MDGNFHYSFFKTRHKFYHIPFKTLQYIKNERPDVVIVQGLKFPLQTIFLHFFLNGKCKLIAQHHAEKPFNGVKAIFHKIADKFIDAYLFTAMGNAEEWFNKKIIGDTHKCYEILEGSTSFKRRDKEACRATLCIAGKDIFIWVGALTPRKDPITVLTGFEKFLKQNADAKLYMIYQEDDLRTEVKSFIDNSNSLKKSVALIGKVDHNELEQWFSASDFFLSGSRNESTGYALLESMACGCIPIVTDIPPFKKITRQYGFLFETGNPDSLYSALTSASKAKKEKLSTEIVNYFNETLSFKKIAEDILEVCKKLSAK